MLVVLGSASGRKIAVCREVFARYFEGGLDVRGCAVESAVPETPHGPETLDGARNRAHACRRLVDADFHVGLESGLVERHERLFEEAWACVLARDGRETAAYSSGLTVPDGVWRRMRSSGRKHHEVMAALERELGLPHDTWSNYSGGLLPRSVSLEEALRNALVQLLSPEGSLYRR